MAFYRIYWIGDDGRIKRGEDTECASDAEAQRVALERIGSYAAIEVWEAGRRVARVPSPAA